MERHSLILTCEHARNVVPAGLDLGVPPEVLASHFAFDAGALVVATALAAATAAPLFTGEYTRLVADLNRSGETPEAVPAVAFGVPIPGNAGLSPAARLDRLDRYWRPYRDAVTRAVAAAAPPVVHIGIHSFDPAVDPAARAFDVGVLFDPARAFERRVGTALLHTLAAAGLDVRENAPYAGTDDGLTTALRLAHPDDAYAGMEVELSQALLREAGATARVVRALAAALPVA